VKILVRGVSVSYEGVKALDGVAVEFAEGSVASIVGPNGAGKTTLLRCLCGILKPRIGAVLLDGNDIGGLDVKEVARRIGYVPQMHPIHVPLTVFEVVLLGRRPYVSWRLSGDDLRIAWSSLEQVGAEHLADRFFDELSGGERRKILLARALAQEPEVLLLDEPTSNLDLRHQLEILGLIRSLAAEHGLTVVMAMHDLNMASRFSDYVVMLRNGRVFAAGEPSKVLTPGNIREVYGVEVEILDNPHLLIVPLRVSA